jgi:BirA family biotin operon repressor/biotin-[acetyl-CoA-carboxylase] ligase
VSAPRPSGPRLGRPRLHLRATTSTNDRARVLAAAGAPHGTVVTAGAQTAGRGRQGRSWSAPPGRALLCSVVLRGAAAAPLLPLVAAVAVAEACGPAARIKWPNDVLLDGGKVAGILAEGRPQEGWAVLGVGVNVAVDPAELPPELHATAATLGRAPGEIEPFLASLLAGLERALALPGPAVLDAWRARDALLGLEVRWAGGRGTAAGLDGEGRLVVRLPGGGRTALDAGEVHLAPGPGPDAAPGG